MSKFGLQSLKNMIKSGTVVKLSSDPYSTHIPFLIGISKLYQPRSILEYGSGLNSTMLFLNRSAFPFVNKLKSYENYKSWYDTVSASVQKNSIIDYKFVDGQMSEFVFINDVINSDLVFIDDSYNSKARSRTVNTVLQFRPKLCLIHDFENWPYRKSVSAHMPYYRFKSLLPNTGCTGSSLDIKKCIEIDRIVSANKSNFINTDIDSWVAVFDKYF